MRYLVNVRGRELGVELTKLSDGRLLAKVEGSVEPLEVTVVGDALELVVSIGQQLIELRPSGPDVMVGGERQPVRVESRERAAAAAAAPTGAASGTVRAPMPGRVVKVLVEAGAAVEKGAGVVVVEAMKMENELAAPRAGVVERVFVAAGNRVERGAPLVEIR